MGDTHKVNVVLIVQDRENLDEPRANLTDDCILVREPGAQNIRAMSN